jgi:hypothetical protein
MTSTSEALRPVAATASLMRSLGLALPDAVAEPYGHAARLRREGAAAPLDARAYARRVIEAGDLTAQRKALTTAAKEYATASAEAEIRRHLAEVAATDALAALHDYGEEITSAILGADALNEAFDVLVDLAPRLPASTLYAPSLEHDSPALVADVARLRAATDTFADVLRSLAAIGLGVAQEPDDAARLAPLLFMAPVYSEELTRSDVQRALSGVLPGASSGSSWKSRGFGPDGKPQMGYTRDSAPGLPVVILAHHGVPFRRVSSLAEWRLRIGLMTGAVGASSVAWGDGDATPVEADPAA